MNAIFASLELQSFKKPLFFDVVICIILNALINTESNAARVLRSEVQQQRESNLVQINNIKERAINTHLRDFACIRDEMQLMN